jgi:hypothetical protein
MKVQSSLPLALGGGGGFGKSVSLLFYPAPGLTTVLTTTPVDVRGGGDTQRTIRRIQLPVRLHSSVGRAADS